MRQFFQMDPFGMVPHNPSHSPHSYGRFGCPIWIDLGHIQMYGSPRCWVWNVKKFYVHSAAGRNAIPTCDVSAPEARPAAHDGRWVLHLLRVRARPGPVSCPKFGSMTSKPELCGNLRGILGTWWHMWAPKIRVIGTSIQLSGWKQTHGKRKNTVVEAWDEHSWYVHMLWFNLGQWLSWRSRSLAIAAGVRALNCKHPVCISCCRQMRALSCPMCRAAPWLHHGHESDGRKGCKRMHNFLRRAAEICGLMCFFIFFGGGLVEAFFVFWGVFFVILGCPFSLFWIVLGWVNGGTCFGFNTCERKALVNPIPHRNSVYHHPTLGAWRLRGWMCQRDCHCPTKCYLAGIVCCILAFAAFFQKATEGNTTKYVVRKIQRTENSGKGRKTADKDGLWKLSSCRKHAQKVLPRMLCFFWRWFLSWNFVESCNPSLSMSMEANAWNVQLWKHTHMCVYIYICNYCTVVFFFQNCFFLQRFNHKEILSSMYGCLSGLWSLVALQLQKWPLGVQVLW